MTRLSVPGPQGPDAPLLVSPRARIETARDLGPDLARRAAALAALRTRAAVVADADRDGVLAVLASLAGSEPPLLVHPRAPEAERRALADALGARVVAATKLADGPPAPEPRFARTTAPARLEADDRSAAFILATSGTTGAPKGVRLSHRALLAAADASAANLGWRAEDRWLLTIPVAHVGGLSIVTRCLLGGVAIALPDALQKGFRPEAFAADVEATGATLASLVPTMLHRLLSAPGFRWPPRLRAALVGGASASPDLLAQAHARGWPVLATYGLTETAAQVATQRLGTPPSATGAVGPPLPGVEVRIRAGRIEVRGPTMFSGYEPAADAAPFGPDGWFDTGDRGAWDDAGGLIVRGRGAELIVTGAENVFPAEVETILRQHPSVADACVVGLDDPEWGQIVGAWVVGAGVSEGALRAFCAERLASFKVPRRFRFASAIPTRPSGKADRVAVRRQWSELG